MPKRYLSIWFPHLKTDWFVRKQPQLLQVPFVLVAPNHGRVVIKAANTLAQSQGVSSNMPLADARAIIPGLQYFDDQPELASKLLQALAEWFIRYTPAAAVDGEDGLMLDISGCAHLWGGEKNYLAEISKKLHEFGYHNSLAIADTIGTAWAIARFGKAEKIIDPCKQTAALLPLPAAALRLDEAVLERLDKLGLRQVSHFIHMPRIALRRRFGEDILLKIDQALGFEMELIQPVIPAEPYQERLPCLEPIVTAKGIEIALERLLDSLCNRLKQEEMGLRKAIFTCYRIDGKIEQIEIGTKRPSSNTSHLFKLFALKIETITPALGIELFVLTAPVAEPLSAAQENIWDDPDTLNDSALSELLDRIEGRIGANHIYRYVPSEHYWPERSYQAASTVFEDVKTEWKVDKPRPLQILYKPAPIEVTAPIPDYPPMNFRYKGKLHKIAKADGPERIEQEWWLQEGQHRDYYNVEDEEGHRYWLFRLGHYDTAKSYTWFMHGFFA